MNRLLLFLLAAFLGGSALAGADDFFFRDGDRVVLIGDSLSVAGTAQRYMDCFIRTRFPQWKFGMRNGGVNGCNFQLGFPLMDADVLAWKPTAVVLNYGMNDGRRKDGLEYYKAGLVPYVDKLQANKVRVALCSNAPMDVGDEPGKFTDFNATFDEMAKYARGFARERGLTFADQFHHLHTVWGENRKRAKPIPVSEQTLSKLSVDSVHLRWGGYTAAAYIILKELGAPGEVSHAAIDVATGKTQTRQCRIQDFRSQAGVVSFVRADESSPCWIDDSGAPGLDLVPFNDELNRMTLQVTGLAAGNYELRIDDQPEGRYSAAALAQGVNLSRNRNSPAHAVGRRVNDLIANQNRMVGEARAIVSFKPPAWLNFPNLAAQQQAEFERRRKEIEAQDEVIAKAAAPMPHRYEIRPAATGEEKKP